MRKITLILLLILVLASVCQAGIEPVEINWTAAKEDFNTTGEAKATSFTIGPNSLDISEWAYLDGQDQFVKIASEPNLVNINMSGNVSRWTNDSGYLTAETDPCAMQYLDQSVKIGSEPNLVNINMSGNVSRWTNDSGYNGYCLNIVASFISPSDNTTYYCGSMALPQYTNPLWANLYIPKAGTIKAVYLYTVSAGGATSNENISIYIRLNNTTDTLIQTIGTTDGAKLFSNISLSIAVVQGDFVEIKIVCPTWVTNPTNWRMGGVIYIE